MLSQKLIAASVRDGAIMPPFLGPPDLAWVELLVREYGRHEGRPRGDLDRHLDSGLAFAVPWHGKVLMRRVLDGLWKSQSRGPVLARVARAKVFVAAVGRARADALASAAAGFGVTPAQLESSLFADLPTRRLVLAPESVPPPVDLTQMANLLWAQGVLQRAVGVRLDLHGDARHVVRYAKLRGLIYTAVPGPHGPILQIAGPMALFRRTRVYGRALAELLPCLGPCPRFALEARVLLGDALVTFALRSGAPIFPTTTPQRHNRLLEARFAKELGKVAPQWRLIHEPRPLSGAGTIIFPDFALYHRRRSEERWLLEVVGFWTPDYLHRKLALLRRAGMDRLILCVDAARQCADGALPRGTRVIWFERQIDPTKVLAIVDSP